MEELRHFLDAGFAAWAAMVLIFVVYLIAIGSLFWLTSLREVVINFDEEQIKSVELRRSINRPRRKDLADDKRWENAIASYQNRLREELLRVRTAFWNDWLLVTRNAGVCVAVLFTASFLGICLLALQYENMFGHSAFTEPDQCSAADTWMTMKSLFQDSFRISLLGERCETNSALLCRRVL